MKTDVLIAGAGLAGLACAMALRGSGLSVSVIERSGVAGGRARSWRDEVTGDVVDIGPHVITSHHRNFLDLLEQCGTRNEVVWQRQPLITLFDGRRAIDARLAPLPAPLALLPAFAKANHLSLHDRLSNARPTWAAMRFLERDVPQLDARDGETWLRSLGVAPAFVDWFWRSMCMTVLNVPLERCSAAALVRAYAQLCGHSGYCFGFPSRGLDDLYLPGVRQRLDAAGIALHFGAPLAHVRIENGLCAGAVLEDGTRIHAPFVVCAMPPTEAAAVLPSALSLPRFEPSRYLCTYLWFDRPVTQARFWTRVWSPDTVNYDFYDLARIRADPPRAGSLIACNAIHAQRLPPLDDEDVIDTALRELGEYAPDARGVKPAHARVHRVPMAVPCPHPGTEQRRPDNAVNEVPGVVLAGDWTHTALPASMESAVRSGRLAAEAVLEQAGRPRSLALPAPPTTGLSGWVRRLREIRGG